MGWMQQQRPAIVVAHVVAGQQQRVSHAEPEREVVDQTVLRRRLDVHAAELDVVRLLEGGAALSCPLLLQLLEHLDLPAATVGAQRSGRFEPRLTSRDFCAATAAVCAVLGALGVCWYYVGV